MVDYRNSDETLMPFAASESVSNAPTSQTDCPETRDAAIVATLTRAALSMNPATNPSAKTIAKDAGISPEQLADHFIPLVARDLGNKWCIDELGFGDVTIGVSRLQAMLRDLGPEWAADQDTHPDASTILLAVPDNTHHTLGALVLSGQLRRKGLSVRLLLGATPQSIQMAIRTTRFDAIFLSAVRGERLEILRKIVDSVHKADCAKPPVVVGGTMLEVQNDIAALTGADYVTDDVDEAISLCNLRTKPRLTTAMEH